MPFSTNADLPDTVKDNVPKHAQDIYRKAFNSAYEQYDTPEERYEDRDREETAHAVAWSAVKNVYEKNDKGDWVKKSK